MSWSAISKTNHFSVWLGLFLRNLEHAKTCYGWIEDKWRYSCRELNLVGLIVYMIFYLEHCVSFASYLLRGQLSTFKDEAACLFHWLDWPFSLREDSWEDDSPNNWVRGEWHTVCIAPGISDVGCLSGYPQLSVQ